MLKTSPGSIKCGLLQLFYLFKEDKKNILNYSHVLQV